jgi:hypothetical protein
MPGWTDARPSDRSSTKRRTYLAADLMLCWRNEFAIRFGQGLTSRRSHVIISNRYPDMDFRQWTTLDTLLKAAVRQRAGADGLPGRRALSIG